MDGVFNSLIVEPIRDFVDRILLFLPNLLLAAVIMAVGFGVSVVIKFLLHKLLATLGLDRYAQGSGIHDLLKKGGIKGEFSLLIARLAFWLLIIMFLIISLGRLDMPEVNNLLSQFFLYMPSVFAAVVVGFIGYVLSNFLAKAALVSAVNSGLTMAGAISKGVKTVVLLLTLTMVLEQLGIGRGTILMVFSISFGGLVLALALAFGLGAKDLAREYLEKRLKEDTRDKDEISHL